MDNEDCTKRADFWLRVSENDSLSHRELAYLLYYLLDLPQRVHMGMRLAGDQAIASLLDDYAYSAHARSRMADAAEHRHLNGETIRTGMDLIRSGLLDRRERLAGERNPPALDALVSPANLPAAEAAMSELRRLESRLRVECRAAEPSAQPPIVAPVVVEAAAIAPPPAVPEQRKADGGDDGLDYVTLDQMAGIVKRSKAALEAYLRDDSRNPMPTPDVVGGGGKAHEWKWDRIRPWLAKTFGRELPETFPSIRP